ncbi:hypothetical protein PR048_000292 [Dryococelus australis]|uniref:Uncharacterized protein n=1 Tax=Dryococelus australis TaxID=614101 RepID=A0ABQ9IFE8_9NEOP|nr:hypothetical protein PR048_000292 [Dryococelus australis]
MSMSAVHWLFTVTVEGDNWATVLQEVSNTGLTPDQLARHSVLVLLHVRHWLNFVQGVAYKLRTIGKRKSDVRVCEVQLVLKRWPWYARRRALQDITIAWNYFPFSSLVQRAFGHISNNARSEVKARVDCLHTNHVGAVPMLPNSEWPGQIRKRLLKETATNVNRQTAGGGRGDVVVRALASHPGEPGSIPSGVESGFSHVGIELDDAAGGRVFTGISRSPFPRIPVPLRTHLASPSSALKTWQVTGFLGISRFPPTPSFRLRFIFTSITLIGSQDLAVKSRRNLFTLHSTHDPLRLFLSKMGNRVRFPAETVADFRKLESCRTMPLVGGFSRGFPVSTGPPFRPCSILTLLRYALTGYQDLDDKIDVQPVYTEVTFAIGSHFKRHALDDSEPISHFHGNNFFSLGGRFRRSAGFPGDIPSPPPYNIPELLHTSPRFTLIGFQDLDVKSHANLSTPHKFCLSPDFPHVAVGLVHGIELT